MIKAGIDLGTHTGRLIIAEVEGNKISRLIYKKAKIIALGEKTALSGKISQNAQERAVKLLQEFAATINQYKAGLVRSVTTNAMRIATNREEVLSRIKKETGINLEVISGEMEAGLGYCGIKSAFSGKNFLSFDIGGGSTEFTLNETDKLTSDFSLKIGSVSLTEKFCHSDPITENEFNILEEAVKEAIKPALSLLQASNYELLIGVAGTVTNLAAIKLRMREYNADKIHNTCLSLSDIGDIITNLLYKTVEQRKEIIGLEPGRAKVILAGTVIVKHILKNSSLTEVTVSEADLLEGLLLAKE